MSNTSLKGNIGTEIRQYFEDPRPGVLDLHYRARQLGPRGGSDAYSKPRQ
ncbi:hypothetical protein EYZ11_006159 [Aspergillus tanneri]|uniref:Uncharacterized protein n=1 Tax=Aspergillus tanneri TaxID=1220188 RepID=A0A4S3JM36_9EURO|nr:hypothetical protein EYZ11_006159 [Aspergillus tanneri]